MPPKHHSALEIVADKFIRWVGSLSSIIVHTILFITSFLLVLAGIKLDDILLILTTVVSLEAIYLAIFIQMSVNRQSETIQNVEENIDEIQEDIDEIQEDVDEIQEDVVGMSVDIEELSEEEKAEALRLPEISLNTIFADLKKLVDDVEKFKEQNKKHDTI
jgi:methyl-accepting chemotaxis protein